jgi:hypothetical protein
MRVMDRNAEKIGGGGWHVRDCCFDGGHVVRAFECRTAVRAGTARRDCRCDADAYTHAVGDAYRCAHADANAGT